jgi:NAD(P)-dependent dehydrogenase (short-subunit alcohol dehydrogenase family)
MIDSKEFDGKRALITGGTRGVGEAIVRRLVVGGATVATTARSPMPDGLSASLFVQADLRTPEGVDKLIRHVLDQLNGLDILIHNAGGSAAPGGGALALTDADWQGAFDMNLFAAVRLDRGFLPSMLRQGSGVIIHVSSIQRPSQVASM